MKHNAAAQDEGAYAILILTAAAAMATVGAIFAELAVIERSDPHYSLYGALAVCTVVLSWAFIHTIFALHYAHDYYGGGRMGGLRFPEDDEPDYWDFIYFAFVIGMTFQVSDVAVTQKSDTTHGGGARRAVVLFHHRVHRHGREHCGERDSEIDRRATCGALIVTTIIQLILGLVVVLVIVAVAAQRLKLAPSILLVIAGIVLALVPGMPPVELAPELVLLVLLPPLIYSAGVSMSWREFRFNLRPIILLAFGCVLFTTCAVAAALHFLLGWRWATAFVLGAIVAPPDVVAPLAIARRLGLPRRLLVVLEGEGLANDATALILYRFAVLAIATGSFSHVESGRHVRLDRAGRNLLRHRRRAG